MVRWINCRYDSLLKHNLNVVILEKVFLDKSKKKTHRLDSVCSNLVSQLRVETAEENTTNSYKNESNLCVFFFTFIQENLF